jgi:hypothetical protein
VTAELLKELDSLFVNHRRIRCRNLLITSHSGRLYRVRDPVALERPIEKRDSQRSLIRSSLPDALSPRLCSCPFPCSCSCSCSEFKPSANQSPERGDGNSTGRSRPGAPVRMLHEIWFRTVRRTTRGEPAFRDSGNKSVIGAHYSSVKNSIPECNSFRIRNRSPSSFDTHATPVCSQSLATKFREEPIFLKLQRGNFCIE